MIEAAREVIIALSNSVEGRDEDFQAWYWQTHIPEVLKLPGFVSAQVFKLLGELGPNSSFRYATIYQIEGSVDEARRRLFNSDLGVTDAMEQASTVTGAFSAPMTIERA